MNLPSIRKWPSHGWLGLVLVAVFWWCNWQLDGLRTHWAFFPLWLGYCLSVDACVFFRTGSSLATRSRSSYIMLFLFSIPSWWLFELLNRRTGNWLYDGREFFTDPEFFALASLSFSTVMPAVFETAELIGTLPWVRRCRQGPSIRFGATALTALFCTGWVLLVLLLLWPGYFFPCMWFSVFLILEPLNVRLGHPSIFSFLRQGDWRPVLSLCAGCLVCGFFWELWNFYSYPKWVYRVPFIDFLHLFEMPLLGYTGYVPFALELYALYHMLAGIYRRTGMAGYINLTSDRQDNTQGASRRS